MNVPRVAHLRSTFTVLCMLAGASVSAGAPPQSVQDSLYSESLIAGSNVLQPVYHLGANGVARRLYDKGWGGATDYKDVYSPSQQLRYAYTPPTQGAPATATIDFSDEQGVLLSTRFLNFQTDRSGTLGVTTSVPMSFQFRFRTAVSGASNVSNRIKIQPDQLSITGFILDETRPVLVRVAGPALSGFGIATPASSTSLTLYSGSHAVVGSNSRWGPTDKTAPDAQAMSWLFEMAGAFPFAANSADSAFFGFLSNGPYTVHATAPGLTSPAEILVEVYVLPYR